MTLKENVKNVQNVIENEYLNPFDLMEECEKQKLFHLRSCVPLPNERAIFIQVILERKATFL